MTLPLGRHLTSSAEETAALGAAIARALDPGDVVVVAGDVGAGKTTMIRGACAMATPLDRV